MDSFFDPKPGVFLSVNIATICFCKENGPYRPLSLILVFDEQHDHLEFWANDAC
jgi:hypothetical protein